MSSLTGLHWRTCWTLGFLFVRCFLEAFLLRHILISALEKVSKTRLLASIQVVAFSWSIYIIEILKRIYLVTD